MAEAETTFYVERHLLVDNRLLSEQEILAGANHVVVLAEPGAGKSSLMESFARTLGVPAISATLLSISESRAQGGPLLIDGFDELARVGPLGVNRVLLKAQERAPSKVFVSSRSSEWDQSTTSVFEEVFGLRPVIAYLRPFNDDEQRRIFENHVPGESWTSFQKEASRFELNALLPNPQFLKLFADAYVESDRYFPNKREIFSLAMDRLAKEVNPRVAKLQREVSISDKVQCASEVFAKLLLSGSEGVSIDEASSSRIYPQVGALTDRHQAAGAAIATRLFRPSEQAGLHKPVHRLVAEYGAAAFLARRIADVEAPLSLGGLLALVAPNSTVRDELRGLLGWLASLGGRRVQEAAIRLDPYAVLANGDPSQLEPACKRLLFECLEGVAERDPYFRRGDAWRRFSVAGLLTDDTQRDVERIISRRDGSHLRELLLELLIDSELTATLEAQLKKLVLDEKDSLSARQLAAYCLLEQDSERALDLVVNLVAKDDLGSIRVAADLLDSRAISSATNEILHEFFVAAARVYRREQGRPVRGYGDTYFIRKVVAQLASPQAEWLLGKLSDGLSCSCGKKHYECHCRDGTSKIMGLILDRYFELGVGSPDGRKVWEWVKNLKFHGHKSADECASVRALQTNHSLRQSAIRAAFSGLQDREKVQELWFDFFSSGGHSGLNFRAEDYVFVAELAAEEVNVALWEVFMARHRYHRDRNERGPDSLRRLMRAQARDRPELMRIWAVVNRSTAEFIRSHLSSSRPSRRMVAKRKKRERKIREQNWRFFGENRKLIETGFHWGALLRFSELLLMRPGDLDAEVGDRELVRNALVNCLEFLSPNIPTLSRLAELQGKSRLADAEVILYAACLEIFRAKGCLESVSSSALRSLRTNSGMSFQGVDIEEHTRLFEEVDRIVFSRPGSAAAFLSEYLEPQVADPENRNPEVWMLRNDEAFSAVRGKVAFEWLSRYPDAPLVAKEELFEIAAADGDRAALVGLLSSRAAHVLRGLADRIEGYDLGDEERFWLLRAWYFASDQARQSWAALRLNKGVLLDIAARASRYYGRDYPNWPDLSVEMISDVLDAFVGDWPPVELPSSWGTSSPDSETAYRFLKDLVWSLGSKDPSEAVALLERLLLDARFDGFRLDLRSLLARQSRRKAQMAFAAPTPEEICAFLETGAVVTVEALRQRICEQLDLFQGEIDGGEFNPIKSFYEGDDRVDERRCAEIVAERLNLVLRGQLVHVTPEHQLKDANRCDITAAKLISGKRRLLVIEVKGQWHRELYTAAAAQLHDRYAIHPDAERQGIYLVIWFGQDFEVAGKKRHGIKSARELRSKLESVLGSALVGLVDVYVLDVSRGGGARVLQS